MFEGQFNPFAKRSRASSTPPISSQRVVGTWTITSRIAEGWTRFSACSKSSLVTDRLSSTSGGIVPSSGSAPA